MDGHCVFSFRKSSVVIPYVVMWGVGMGEYKTNFVKEWNKACNDIKAGNKKHVARRRHTETNDNDALLELGNAVVIKACEDYRWAVRHLHRLPKYRKRKLGEAEEMYWDCVDFFLGKNFNIYTTMDGEFVLSVLEKEQEEMYGTIIRLER